MVVGGLFDGIGLLAYGLHLAGHEHAWLCEVDPFRRQVLARRWPGVRIFDDVRAVGAATAERVDVIAGGFPCKGASSAGKRNGFDHPETVLWREMARAVGELRPRFVVVENVADLLSVRGGAVWGEVLGTLATLGFDVVWDCIPAGAFGAPHLRDRVIAVAADADQGGWGAGTEQLAWPSGAPGIDWPVSDGDIDIEDAADAAGQPERIADDEADAVPGEWRARALSRSGTGIAQAPADTGRGGQPEHAQCHCERWRRLYGPQWQDAERRGVRVEWGEYAGAIARWEAIFGSAPEPLVRRVDDRRAMRVERSRLSALGDGVQVQLGQLVGRYLMEIAS